MNERRCTIFRATPQFGIGGRADLYLGYLLHKRRPGQWGYSYRANIGSGITVQDWADNGIHCFDVWPCNRYVGGHFDCAIHPMREAQSVLPSIKRWFGKRFDIAEIPPEQLDEEFAEAYRKANER